MRSEQEVAVKLEQVYNKILAERKSAFLSRTHMNCVFNQRCRVKQNGKIGFCCNEEVLKGTKRNFFVCDEEQTALACPFYQCAHTEESIENDLKELIKDPARCGELYPKLMVLIWVLQNESKAK